MFEAQRQHPAAALANAFDIIRGNFITILILIFVGSSGDQGQFILYWIFGTFVVLLIWGVISWLRFRYSVNEGELKIEQGVFVRKKMYLSSDRIQVIDISAGVIQRLFGLVAVEVKTAGSSSKEAKINAVSREKAQELKTLLRKESRDAEDAEAAEEEADSRIYQLSTRDLIIAASTSGRMGVALSIVGAFFSQIDLLISEEQMIRFIETNIPRSTSTALVVMSVVAIIVVSWLFSFLSTIIIYYNFKVEVRENDLLISRGLFERTQLTIPFNRIQAVQIKEGIMRQPFGYASLVIESAGYGEDEGNSNTLFPLISKKQMYDFIREVIPEYDVEIKNSVTISQTGLRRYLLRMVWISLVIIALLWGMVPYGVYSWFVLIPMLLLGYQQYLDAEVQSSENTLIMSSRLLSKTTAIIKKFRVQATQLRQNPFQSRLNLADLVVHVASGNKGRSFRVRELGYKEASAYKEWLSNRYSDRSLLHDPDESSHPDSITPE